MARKRKILLYVHGLTGGGAERVWALLASGLSRRGHDVLLVTDFTASANATYIDPGVRQVVLGGGHVATIRKLARLMREEQPDVNLAALSLSNLKLGIAAMLAGQLSRSIVTYHGYTDTEPQLLSRLGYFSTPLLSRLTAATVCVSDGLLDYVVNRFLSPAEKTVRIYNPVVSNASDDGNPLPLAQRQPIVLSSGRMISYKNFPALIRAFAKVTFPDARLRILGEGPEMDTIRKEIERLELQSRVDLLGYQPHPWIQYEEARCFVLPSNREPFGLVLVEALAHGLPVIATDCHGPREILTGGIGTIVAQGDEDAMARAMSEALANPGEPGPRYQHASLFSLDTGLDQYEVLFESILGKGFVKPRSGSALTLPQT